MHKKQRKHTHGKIKNETDNLRLRKAGEVYVAFEYTCSCFSRALSRQDVLGKHIVPFSWIWYGINPSGSRLLSVSIMTLRILLLLLYYFLRLTAAVRRVHLPTSTAGYCGFPTRFQRLVSAGLPTISTPIRGPISIERVREGFAMSLRDLRPQQPFDLLSTVFINLTAVLSPFTIPSLRTSCFFFSSCRPPPPLFAGGGWGNSNAHTEAQDFHIAVSPPISVGGL